MAYIPVDVVDTSSSCDEVNTVVPVYDYPQIWREVSSNKDKVSFVWDYKMELRKEAFRMFNKAGWLI